MRYLFLCCFLTTIFSCTSTKKERIAYNELDFINLKKEDSTLTIKVVDTFCINQTKKAQQDILANKLRFTYHNPLPEKQEMAILLKQFNIESSFMLNSCLEGTRFNLLCYENTMKEAISKKYGTKFIDSLWKVARKNFIIKNPDFEYIENGEDIRKQYLK